MTNYYKQIQWSQKHKDLNFVNSICSNHDLWCCCNDPLKHTIITILKQEPTIKFDKEDSKIIQKCLTTTEDGGDGDVLDGFGDGELEKLFGEDIGEEDTDG